MTIRPGRDHRERGDLKPETDFEFAYLRFLNAIAIAFDQKNSTKARKSHAEVDKFGIPYEEGVPRPGWKPLGRLQ